MGSLRSQVLDRFDAGEVAAEPVAGPESALNGRQEASDSRRNRPVLLADASGGTLGDLPGFCVPSQTAKPSADINLIPVSGGKDSTALLLWALHDSGYDRATIRATFCDTGNEHPSTLAYVAKLSATVWPVETLVPALDFYALAQKKGRFPSVRARFCTESLKMWPSKVWVDEHRARGFRVRIHTGVRAEESEDRANLSIRTFDGYYGCEVFRPLLGWTLDEVWAYLAQHGVAPNPLYAAGASRVGCFPCVLCRKAEMRLIARKFPEVIDQLREREKAMPGGFRSFFAPSKVPARFRSVPVVTKAGETVNVPTIDDVVRWATESDPDAEEDTDAGQCRSSLGACE